MADDQEPDANEYVREALGASRSVFQKRFAIYIPDKDRHGNPLPDKLDGESIPPDYWIRQSMRLLGAIGGGATALPAALAIWQGKEENTVIVYSHMDSETFDQNKFILRAFLHEFGREADQGEVLAEYGSAAFFIDEYDPKPDSQDS